MAQEVVTLDHAVYVLNDWSGGQLYNLTVPDYYTEERLAEYLQMAQMALEHRHHELTDYAIEVAEKILALAPSLLDAQMARRLQRTTASLKRVAQPASKAGYVYLLQSPTGAYKIGRTRNPSDRLRTFGVLLPFEVEFVCVIESENMFALEGQLHAHFASKRGNGEWFALVPEDVEYLKGLAK